MPTKTKPGKRPGSSGGAAAMSSSSAPEVTSISPSSGVVGDTVVINGTNFNGVTTVKFGTEPATFSVEPGDVIVATAPTNQPGLVHITVTTAEGTSEETPADQFSYVSQAPVVSSITPQSGQAGHTIFVSGSNFVDVVSVKFDDEAAAFTVYSDTDLTVTVPLGAGTVHIRVENLFGVSAEAPGNQFTYSVMLPTVSSVDPSSGKEGDQVIVTGTNFSGVTSVCFGTEPASFTVLSATEIRATVPAGTGGDTVHVRVTTAAGTSPEEPGDEFTYVSTTPNVTSVTPPQGSEGDTVVLGGTNFTGANSVTFGSTPAPFQVDSDTQITCTVPAGTGTVHVRVTSIAGTSPDLPSNEFSYVSTAPTVDAVTPAMGYEGDTVLISGSNFTGTTSVAFGSVLASFAVDNDNQITAEVPTNPAAETVNVIVTNSGGSSAQTPASEFTYL